MNKIFKLAVRNLSRQKRRNVILAIAIAFGFFVVTVIDGLTTGMVGNLEDMITQLTGGNILISAIEIVEPTEPGAKPSTVNIIREPDYIRNIIETSNIEYESISCFTITGGTMLFNGKETMINMYGRDLLDEGFVDSMQFVEGGIENLNMPNPLIISDKTSSALNLSVGDQIIFTGTTRFGQNNVEDFTIAAIYKTNSIMNTIQAYSNLETVNKFSDMPEGSFNNFSIYLKDKNKQEAVAAFIEKEIRADGKNVSDRMLALQTNPTNIVVGFEKQFDPTKTTWEGEKYVVESLNDEVPQIKTVLSIVHLVTTIILIVILLIVMVGVSNTYRMVLYERIREIGTMRALGMNGKDTGKVFTTEAVILCIIGALGGIILATIAMEIIHLIPVNDEMLSFFLKDGHFTFELSTGSIIVQYILLIVLTSLAVRGSAKKAASMSPAEALRTVK